MKEQIAKAKLEKIDNNLRELKKILDRFLEMKTEERKLRENENSLEPWVDKYKPHIDIYELTRRFWNEEYKLREKGHTIVNRLRELEYETPDSLDIVDLENFFSKMYIIDNYEY